MNSSWQISMQPGMTKKMVALAVEWLQSNKKIVLSVVGVVVVLGALILIMWPASKKSVADNAKATLVIIHKQVTKTVATDSYDLVIPETQQVK